MAVGIPEYFILGSAVPFLMRVVKLHREGNVHPEYPVKRKIESDAISEYRIRRPVAVPALQPNDTLHFVPGCARRAVLRRAFPTVPANGTLRGHVLLLHSPRQSSGFGEIARQLYIN